MNEINGEQFSLGAPGLPFAQGVVLGANDMMSHVLSWLQVPGTLTLLTPCPPLPETDIIALQGREGLWPVRT